jgi:hypothetical protein
MDYSTAVKRLWNHANLPEEFSRFPKEESFCFALFQATQMKQQPELRGLYDDIMSCLEVLNLVLNTSTPEKSTDRKAKKIDRETSYAVSTILSASWLAYYRLALEKTFSDSFLHDLAGFLVKIETGWNLVLAGDSEKIQKETEMHFEMYLQSSHA